MNRIFILLASFIGLVLSNANAQFAPQAPLAGHEGIQKNDTRIKAWVKDAVHTPGWIQITDTAQGKVASGNIDNVKGAPNNNVISLGDGGSVICTFEHPIKNGEGPDFAVFENGFLNVLNKNLAFLELAFVEVSSNGVDFVRFPSVSNIQDTIQFANDSFADATLIHNLAGKYILNYGTPFDLEDLKDSTKVDIGNITHIKVVDVIGILDENLASRDVNGRMINDPFPTPFLSCGFDLDAIGVINSTHESTNLLQLNTKTIKVYPIPANDIIKWDINEPIDEIRIIDMLGNLIFNYSLINDTSISEINIKHLPAQTYNIQFIHNNNVSTTSFQKI